MDLYNEASWLELTPPAPRCQRCDRCPACQGRGDQTPSLATLERQSPEDEDGVERLALNVISDGPDPRADDVAPEPDDSPVATAGTTSPRSFLNLPLEIRDMIYLRALDLNMGSARRQSMHITEGAQAGQLIPNQRYEAVPGVHLMSTSRQIHREAAHWMYQNLLFDDWNVLRQLIVRIPLHMSIIRRVTIRRFDIPPIRDGPYGCAKMSEMLRTLVKAKNLERLNIVAVDDRADPGRSSRTQCPYKWQQARANHLAKAAQGAWNGQVRASLYMVMDVVEAWRTTDTIG